MVQIAPASRVVAIDDGRRCGGGCGGRGEGRARLRYHNDILAHRLLREEAAEEHELLEQIASAAHIRLAGAATRRLRQPIS